MPKNMWRIIKYILSIVILTAFVVYSFYQCEEKNLFNNGINQLEFNFVLLEILHKGEEKEVGTLLSADIQRVLIDISINRTMEDTTRLCQYINKDRIKLLEKYDNNISIKHINRIVAYCKNSTQLE